MLWPIRGTDSEWSRIHDLANQAARDVEGRDTKVEDRPLNLQARDQSSNGAPGQLHAIRLPTDIVLIHQPRKLLSCGRDIAMAPLAIMVSYESIQVF